MTWLELKQWCKDNNVPDDAVLVALDGYGEYSPAMPAMLSVSVWDKIHHKRLGITDTTTMVVEL